MIMSCPELGTFDVKSINNYSIRASLRWENIKGDKMTQ